MGDLKMIRKTLTVLEIECEYATITTYIITYFLKYKIFV